VQIGRFASSLSLLSNACELARADCAPKPCGNGTITVSDWVQAGRYVAQLDSPAATTDCLAGGAGFSPAGGWRAEPSLPVGQHVRWLTATDIALAPGLTNRLPILMQAQGNEAGISFSLSYDPNLLTLVSADCGPDARNAILHFNTNRLAQGQIGLILALPTGTAFAAGPQVVAELGFRAASGTKTLATPITFIDQPVVREICDVEARALPASHQDGTAVIWHGDQLFLTATQAEALGRMRVNLIGSPGVWELQTSQGDGLWAGIIHLTNRTGREQYSDSNSTNFSHRFYRAVRRSP